MVGPERFERPTPSFVAKCSIQLSYGPPEHSLYTTTPDWRQTRTSRVRSKRVQSKKDLATRRGLYRSNNSALERTVVVVGATRVKKWAGVKKV